MFDTSIVQGAQTVNFNAIAAWVFLFWDICLTFDDEVEHIWRMPNMLIKRLYYFIRYFGLASQTGHRIFAMWIASSMTATPLICTTFRAVLAITTQSLLICMHLILMLQVFALYDRKRWVGVLFLSLLGAQNVAQVISVAYAIPAIPFNPICHIERIPRFAAMHGFATIFTQTIILGLTIVKYVVALRAGWERTPLVRLMIRDGALMFIVTSAILLSATLFVVFGVEVLGMDCFWWIHSTLSASGYRVIVNMQRLRTPQRSEPIELTTDFCDIECFRD